MKTSLTILTILICAVCAGAQTRPRYVFDNFSSGGVKIQPPLKPAANPVLAAKLRKKDLVRKTAQVTPVNAEPLITSVDAGMMQRRASSNSERSLRGYSTGDMEVDGFIVNSCARYGVDPLLIYSQMSQESSFKLRATSNKGARGLMQLMPATAARFGVANIYDPQQNIEGGVRYMRWLLDTFNGDISLALAGYNAGENAVMKYGWSIPPYNETQDYVRRISTRYQSLRGGSLPLAVAAKPIPIPTQTLEVKKAGSINIDERAVFAVKTRDGKTQLVSQ